MQEDHNNELDLMKQRFLQRYTMLISMGSYALMILLLVYSFIKDMKDIMYLIAGAATTTGLKDASGFWFGSSLVSRDKDRSIATLTDTQKENTVNVALTKTEEPDAILSTKDDSLELALLEATEPRTDEQEKRLQELKQNSKNV